MKLSIIIPVYNEQDTVERILGEIDKIPHEKEVIVVDDCSTDDTYDILRKIDDRGYKIIHNIENRGKGYALRLGIKNATGDYIVIQDADLEYSPGEIPKLVAPIEKGEADVVYGSRFMELNEGVPWRQRVANGFFNWLTNLIHGTRFTDVCTCYKLFPRAAAEDIRLKADGFEICHEINAKLVGRYRMIDIPIRYSPRSYAEGKKVSWTDIFPSTWAILKHGLRTRFRRRSARAKALP